MTLNNVSIQILLNCAMFFPLIILIVPWSIWNIHFLNRIKQFIGSYRSLVAKAKSDPFGNFSEKALHHKSEIIKYIFLLLINISEFVSGSFCALGSAFLDMSNGYEYIHSNSSDTISNCTNALTQFPSLDFSLIYGHPISSMVLSTGQALLILSGAFNICLMKYLHETFHDISSNPFRYIKRFLSISSLVVISIIITGSVAQLKILHSVALSIFPLVCFLIWIQHSRIFYRTLRWRALELRVRSSREGLVRRAVISCYQFKLIMWCVGLGYFCLTLRQFLESLFSLVTIATFYGPCLFHYLYGTPYYQPLIVTQQQIEALRLCDEILSSINTILAVAVFLLTVLLYVVCTALFFGRTVINKLKYRFGCVRVRFTPSLTHHLLPEQEPEPKLATKCCSGIRVLL